MYLYVRYNSVNVAFFILLLLNYAFQSVAYSQHKLKQQHEPIMSTKSRRFFLSGFMSMGTYVSSSQPSNSAVYKNSDGLQGKGGTISRVEGIGGGFDIRTPTTAEGQDVIYPASMVGPWKCSRIVISVEGDVGQAEKAWKLLGGGNKGFREEERYTTRFIVPENNLGVQNKYAFDGKEYEGSILDRGYEMSQRASTETVWRIDALNDLSYVEDKKGSNMVDIAVVQRKLELPNEKGWGFNELYRISSSAGGAFEKNKVERAIRVQRRYRRAMDDAGNRTVEALEIMKTYRVLDGVAGIEMPTSTTKSQIRLTRDDL